jgi:hypothetical protein
MQPGLSATTSLPFINASTAMAERRSGTAAVTITSMDGSWSRLVESSIHIASGQRSRTDCATEAASSSELSPTSWQP